MPALTSSQQNALKRLYSKYSTQQQNLEAYGFNEISKSSKKYNAAGAGFFGGVKVYGNEAVGAINENEQFRTADEEIHQQYKVIPKIQSAPIKISGLLASVAEDQSEAFADKVVDELEGARERCLKDLNRQFYGKGDGLLAHPSAAVASNATSFTPDSSQYLRANMVVDIFNGATKTVDSIRISDVDKVNNVVYLATSLGAAIDTTYDVVKENVRDSAAADGKEHMGLRGIIDDSTDITTIEQLDSTSLRVWRGVRIAPGSVNLTSDLLQRLLDDVRIIGGKDPDLILMHHKQRRKYLDIVVPQRRYADGKMDAGHSKLSFNGMDLMLDEDCQIDTVYAVRKEFLQQYMVRELALASIEDAPEFLRMSGFDLYEACWLRYGNFGTDKRNAHGKLTGLATPSGVS